jgi:hypothetical protein
MSSRDQATASAASDRVRQAVVRSFAFEESIQESAVTMNFLPTQPSGFGTGPRMYGIRSMRVVKLVVQTTGTYNDQWRRPLVSQMDGHTLNQVESVIDRTKSLDSLAFAQPAFAFLKPSPTPESRSIIANGWQTERLRFWLNVVVEDNMGIATNHYYWGYTEYSDLSLSGRIDPNMIFTINSFSSTKTVHQRTPNGVRVLQTPILSSQVLSAPKYEGVADPGKLFSLKPESVIDDLGTEDLRDHTTTFLNTSTVISSPTPSARNNNVPPNYVAKLVRGYYNTLMGNSDGAETYSQQLDHVKEVIKSEDGYEDPFLAWLQDRRVKVYVGLGNMLAHNQLKIEDLETLDPGCSARVHVANDPRIVNNMHRAGQTCDWGASTPEAQFATLLAQSLPAYMSQFQLTRLVVQSTNMQINGEIMTLITSYDSINNQEDLSFVLQALQQRLNTELFMALSHGNSLPFEVEVACDMIGETWVTISLAQNNQEQYVCPTFCDSLFTPMTSSDERTLQGLTHDFGQVFRMLDDKVARQNNTELAIGSGGQASVLYTPSSTRPIPTGLSAPLIMDPFSRGASPAPTLPPSNNPFPFGNKDPGF